MTLHNGYLRQPERRLFGYGSPMLKAAGRVQNYSTMASAGLIVCLVFLLNVSLVRGSDGYPRGQILVFGGNGFMGAATTRALVSEHYAVAIVNRGNWYWDSAEIVRPYVHQVVCDRYAANITIDCPELVAYIEQIGHFAAVVDFSALNGQAMENSLKLLNGKVDLYIYISSDSLYEISERHYDGPSREDGAIVPEDPIYLELLTKADDYAWGKVEGEQVLRQYAKTGLKYVALRLPDVIGPRDTFEDRFFSYHLWIRLSVEMKKPVYVPSQFINAPVSMVYVDDVANIIPKLLDMDISKLDTAYNLAFRERFTLLYVLQTMQKEMGIANIQYELDTTNEYYLWLPSVKRGPVDISKAVKELGWNPSNPEVVIRETVNFFDDAMRQGAFKEAYRRQRERVVRRIKEAIFKGQETDLDLAIDATYGRIEEKPEKTQKEEVGRAKEKDEL